MSILALSENLARMRKEKKMTQDALADFIGVTKASVSKWETGQCLPDLMLLPRLAAFFHVSIDDLIGYKPQLSPEQIQKIYSDFSAAFVTEPFDAVMERVRETAKQYYACYPLLLQLCVLYLNHASLAKNPAAYREVLSDGRTLCAHIISDCDQVTVCSDAISMKSVFDLLLGDVNDVIDALEPGANPARFSGQNDALLIQAYRAAGKQDTAVDFAQISIYLHLLSLVGISTQYLDVHGDDRDSCYATMARIDAVADVYQLPALHPNTMAQFHYQAALCCLGLGDEPGALSRLSQFADIALTLFKADTCKLHGDAYFTRIDRFIGQLILGASPPRDKSFIVQSMQAALQHPALAPLREHPSFIEISNRIEEMNHGKVN